MPSASVAPSCLAYCIPCSVTKTAENLFTTCTDDRSKGARDLGFDSGWLEGGPESRAGHGPRLMHSGWQPQFRLFIILKTRYDDKTKRPQVGERLIVATPSRVARHWRRAPQMCFRWQGDPASPHFSGCRCCGRACSIALYVRLRKRYQLSVSYAGFYPARVSFPCV